MHSASRNSRRHKSSTSKYSAPFDDTEDVLPVSHPDHHPLYHDSRLPKTSRSRYKSRSQDRRQESNIPDDYPESHTRRQEDDWRPPDDRSRYLRDQYQNAPAYDYDSSVNNWVPNSSNHSQSSRRTNQRDWRDPSSSDYPNDMQRYPDRQPWDDGYDPRHDSFDRWTPGINEGSDRPRYDFERGRENQLQKDRWPVEEWRPTPDEYEWSGERNDKEDRTWVSREDSNDRTWKPASSWQQSQEGGDFLSQRRRNNQQKTTQPRKGWQQRNHSKYKDRRDSIQENTHDRPSRHSPSLSPPRVSSAYRSPHRSRSRSKTPKRRRVDMDSFDRRDPSPRHYVRRRDSRYQEKSRSSTSPPPRTVGDRFRRRSPSRSVSRSPSPDPKPAARHRLPLVSHAGQALESRQSRDKKESPLLSQGRDMAPQSQKDLRWHPSDTSWPKPPTTSPSHTQSMPNTKISLPIKNSSFRKDDRLFMTSWDDQPSPNSTLLRSEAFFVKRSEDESGPTLEKNYKASKTSRMQINANLKKFFPGEEDDTPLDPARSMPETLSLGTSANEVKQSNGTSGKRGSVSPRDDEITKSFTSHGDDGEDTEKQMSLSPHSPPPTALSVHPSDHQSERSDRTQKDLFQIVSQVGEGTFGKVYKARNTASGAFVALKKIRMEGERDGFPVTAMREIKLLQSLQHMNVVRLHEMMVSHGHAHMVFEYMDHDLTGILGQTQFVFSAAHLKSLCRQMLSGLSYLHQKGVVHRDIKGSNILINNGGELKLADFGLARFYQKRRRADYTNRVITLWYRPPELLLGATVYGPEVDMWSAGCIMLELFTKKPVFQGNDEIHQLEVLYKILGTPTPNDWPGMIEMPWYELVKPRHSLKNHFRDFFNKWLSPGGMDLAQLLLLYDPERRITASDALKASYFEVEEPPEELPVGLSSLDGEWHEYEHKRERARRKRAEG